MLLLLRPSAQQNMSSLPLDQGLMLRRRRAYLPIALAVLCLFSAVASASASSLVAIEAPDHDNTSRESDHISSLPRPAEDSNGPLPSPGEFVPTDEWQVVQPGQAIPPGLHVSIDMQTGEKKAKKMEESLGRPTLSEKRAAKLQVAAEALVSDAETAVDRSTMAGASIHQMADAIAEKWNKTPIAHQEEAIRVALRILKRLSVSTFTNDTLSGGDTTMSSLDVQQLSEDLDELEDMVHDGDVAQELEGMGLLDILSAMFCQATEGRVQEPIPFSAREAALLSKIALVLGASMQNNEPVVRALAATPRLGNAAVRLMQISGDNVNLQKRVLFLLASMLRSMPDLISIWAMPGSVLDSTIKVHQMALTSGNSGFLRKTATLLADLMIAEMRLTCPHLVDGGVPEEDVTDQGTTNQLVAQRSTELTKTEMAQVRAQHASECASETQLRIAPLCSGTLDAWVVHHPELDVQEALLELITMLACPLEQQPVQGSVHDAHDADSVRLGQEGYQAILRARADAWEAIARQDQDDFFGYLASLAHLALGDASIRLQHQQHNV
eukprot:m.163279 g.163279  ORF g.163279 m.163279 type:complete len:554 (+) comp16389_c0_seq11:198-1859(+)